MTRTIRRLLIFSGIVLLGAGCDICFYNEPGQLGPSGTYLEDPQISPYGDPILNHEYPGKVLELDHENDRVTITIDANGQQIIETWHMTRFHID